MTDTTAIPTSPTASTAPTVPARVDERSPEETARRDGLVDVGFTALLALLALLALGPAFGGTGYLVVGSVGLVAGLAAAYLSVRLRAGPTLTIGLWVAVLVLLSGPSVAHAAPGGVVPSPAGLQAFLRGLVHAWVDAATTAAPVGVDGGLGVLPYVAGAVAGLGGGLLALRTRLTLLPAAPPLAALVIGILFGTAEPQSLLLQGGAFTVTAIGWGAVRANRSRRDVHGTTYWPRIASGGLMLVLTATVGLLAGPRLPFVDAGSRQVLRGEIQAPFDPRAYPSPLGGLRNYLSDEGKERELLSVRGLPEGSSLRLATMDTYDGVVWVVGGPGASASGTFDRVGTAILPTPEGEAATLDVAVDDYAGVWVPTVGSTRSVAFTSARGDDLGRSFRFNRETGDGASPAALAEGDQFTAEVRERPLTAEDAEGLVAGSGALAALPPLPTLPEELVERAAEIASGATNDYDRARQIQGYFLEGYYSNGGPDAPPEKRSAPGHSAYRLAAFLDSSRAHPVGDEEQYAAAMAVVARLQGLPARVVMGFTVPDDERGSGSVSVEGVHADAWVEINFEGAGWVPFDATPDRDREPEPQPKERPEPIDVRQQPEPVNDYLQPPDLDPNVAASSEERDDPDRADGGGRFALPRAVVLGLTYVGLPLSGVAASLGFVVMAKRLRRNRRRTRGSPVDRAAGAWREAVDAVRDRGVVIPRSGTRRDVALAVPAEIWAGSGALAAQVDALMFRPEAPTLEAADAVWAEIDGHRRALREPLSRTARLRASTSLRSFRPLR